MEYKKIAAALAMIAVSVLLYLSADAPGEHPNKQWAAEANQYTMDRSVVVGSKMTEANGSAFRASKPDPVSAGSMIMSDRRGGSGDQKRRQRRK